MNLVHGIASRATMPQMQRRKLLLLHSRRITVFTEKQEDTWGKAKMFCFPSTWQRKTWRVPLTADILDMPSRERGRFEPLRDGADEARRICGTCEASCMLIASQTGNEYAVALVWRGHSSHPPPLGPSGAHDGSMISRRI